MTRISATGNGRRPTVSPPARVVPKHDIFVIGGSAGSVEAMMRLVAGLPADLPASVFVAVHTSAEGPGLLAGVLGRHSQMKVLVPNDGDALLKGRMYVAPPDKHMVLEHRKVRVLHGPRENGNRPAVDPLFRSAARVFGPRVVGVVLSGYLDDGTAGLVAIQRNGGVTVVQEPQDALVKSMPENAIRNLDVDYVVPLDAMPALFTELAQTKTKRTPHLIRDMQTIGTPSAYTCPECSGTLWEVKNGNLLRFHCRVGHAYSTESMLAMQGDAVERALWAAMRSLQERSDLYERLAEQAAKRKGMRLNRRYAQRAEALKADATVLRDILTNQREPKTLETHDPRLANSR